MRWNFRTSGYPTLHRLTFCFLGTFFDAWLEGAEIMEMPDKAATTNNFPDARRDAERTIITCDPPSLECHLDGQPAD